MHFLSMTSLPNKGLGRPLLLDEPIDQRLNLKLTASQKRDLLALSKKTGASPSELIRRALSGENSSVVSTEAMREMARVVMEEIQSQQTCIRLDEEQRRQLEEAASQIGYLDGSGLLKVMALQAINDPGFVGTLLSASTEHSFATEAKASIETKKSGTKGRKAA